MKLSASDLAVGKLVENGTVYAYPEYPYSVIISGVGLSARAELPLCSFHVIIHKIIMF